MLIVNYEQIQKKDDENGPVKSLSWEQDFMISGKEL
jgi:hypothetical protein